MLNDRRPLYHANFSDVDRLFDKPMSEDLYYVLSVELRAELVSSLRLPLLHNNMIFHSLGAQIIRNVNDEEI